MINEFGLNHAGFDHFQVLTATMDVVDESMVLCLMIEEKRNRPNAHEKVI
jgi:Trk K+ transport system NAD-binding subunit